MSSSTSTNSSVINALVGRLGTSANNSQDDPTTRLSNDLLFAFKAKARWITRLKGPFLNIKAVLLAGISSDTPEDDEYLTIFDEIMELHPKLREFTAAVASGENLEGYHTFGSMLSELMSDSRACDSNRLVSQIIGYIPINVTAVSAPPLPPNDKSKRGWNHDATAAALCPLKLRTKFRLDPIGFRNSVQSGTLKIKTGDYPCFLYPHDVVYNSESRATGLFRGHIFIRALRSIYTGPSSAFTGHRTAARASNSELNGMKEVTPEMIAYISVQAHYALSDLKSWSDISHSSFNYPKFFKNVVKLFRNRDSTWVKETLEYLTNELPALKHSRRGRKGVPDSDSDQDSEDDTEAMLAQQRDNDADQLPENNNNSNGQSGGRREGREDDITPHRSSPTPPPNPPPDTQPDPGFEGWSPPRATTDNTAPTRTQLLANNRRSRSVENEEDEQRRLGSLRITIPSTRTENLKPKKRRRRY